MLGLTARGRGRPRAGLIFCICRHPTYVPLPAISAHIMAMLIAAPMYGNIDSNPTITVGPDGFACIKMFDFPLNDQDSTYRPWVG